MASQNDIMTLINVYASWGGVIAAVLWGGFYCSEPAHAQSSPKPDITADQPRAISVTSRKLNSFRKNAGKTVKVGKLKWLGGLVLSSSDPVFGGYSGLELSSDGKRFVAVSDAGSWLTGKIIYKNNRMVGVGNTRTGALKALGNKILRRRRDRDAEAVRLVAGNLISGTALISFEINQRIGLFPIRSGQIAGPVRYLRPRHRMPANKGLESVALVGGANLGNRRHVVAFAERALDANGHHRGFLWRRGSGQAQPLALLNLQGFDITDAAGLPDGRLLVLERRFRWSEGIKMRIREISAKNVRSGVVMNGRTLLRADLRYEIDNMEGISVHRDTLGRTVLTLISDNNFNTFLQRTLLLQFELPR